jgi:hypothetical protein
LQAASCGGIAIGQGVPVEMPPPLDVTPHLAEALVAAGKRVVANVLSYAHCPQCGERMRLQADGNDDALSLCINASCGYSARRMLERA